MHSIQQFLEDGIKNLYKAREELSKDPKKFAEFVDAIRVETNRFELNFIAEYFENRDKDIIESPERKKNWCVVKKDEKQLITSLGVVRFRKTLFKHKVTGERGYLLDRVMNFDANEKITEDALREMLTEAVETSYRRGGEETCSNEDKVSKQTVKRVIHSLEFPEYENPGEKKKVDILYIDADEDHIPLQFKECRGDLKAEDGPKSNTLLSKLAYVYEGIEAEAPRSKRYRLINPYYFSGVYEGADNSRLWGEVLDYIEKEYDIYSIKKIYINGDGGAWIRESGNQLTNTVMVLDEYHINKYLTQMTAFLGDSAGDARDEMRRIIREGNKSDFTEYCDQVREYAEDEGTRKRIDEGERYITNNWRAAKTRLIRKEGVIGSSTEAHVEHVLSTRMSSDPMGWSKTGADKMSHLRAYKFNHGNILDLVRYQAEVKEQRLAKAAGAEDMILSVSEILASERSHATSAQQETARYAEHMFAEISARVKETFTIREHLSL